MPLSAQPPAAGKMSGDLTSCFRTDQKEQENAQNSHPIHRCKTGSSEDDRTRGRTRERRWHGSVRARQYAGTARTQIRTPPDHARVSVSFDNGVEVLTQQQEASPVTGQLELIRVLTTHPLHLRSEEPQGEWDSGTTKPPARVPLHAACDSLFVRHEGLKP